MAGVRIIADSSVSQPEKLIDKYSIHLAPETIIFGKRVYRNGIDLAPQDFDALLEQAEELPSKFAPPPQNFYDAYQRFIPGAK